MQPNQGELARSSSTNQLNKDNYEKDFELLKKPTEVIYNGIRTKITGGGVIVKLLSNYMEDIWDYLTEKYPENNFSEGEAWDYDPRFQYLSTMALVMSISC